MGIYGKMLAVCIAFSPIWSEVYAQTVKASSFGFHPEDATACLQNAINSNARRVIVDYQGKDWIIEPVTLVSDQEIIFEENVTIRAKKGAFKGKNDSLFTAWGRKNIILRGNGNVKMIMNKADYQNGRLYSPAEWRNCLSIFSCENVKIQNLTLIASGGDGIYLGHDWKNKRIPYCRNILIENVKVSEQHRQGISVISAENLVIRNCSFNDTKGTPPAAGIDFEPNMAGERLVNCILENCTFNNNQGSGIEFFLNALTAKSIPVSVTVKGCSIAGNSANIRFMQGRHENVRGKIDFIDCKLFSKGRQNVAILGLGARFKIGFTNLKVDNTGNPSEAFSIASGFEPMGKILFNNVLITDQEKRSAIGVNLFQGKLPFRINAFGDIRLNGKIFDIEQFCINYERLSRSLKNGEEDIKVERLAIPGKMVPLEKTAYFRIRSGFKFIQYCKEGEPLEIDIAARAAGRNKNSIVLEIYEPDGKLIRSQELAPGKTLHLSDKVEKTGFYQIKCDPRRNLAVVTSKKPGQAIVPVGLLQLMNPAGNLYFEVPKGVEKFGLMVAGDPGEYVTATLLNPDGKIMQRREHFDTPHIFNVIRENKHSSEVWAVRFENASEDVAIRLGSGLKPVFAVDPALLLRKK